MKKAVVILTVVLLLMQCQTESFGQELKLDSVSGLKYVIKKGQTSGNIFVIMHGYGSNEKDLFSFRQHFPKATFICLRAPLDLRENSYSWYDISFTNGVKTKDFNQVNKAALKLKLFLKNLKKVKGQKVILGGFSQGAIMSLKMVIEQPTLIDGVMCFSGSTLGNNFKPDPKLSVAYSKTKAFYAHGVQDDVLPIEKGRACKKILQNAKIPTTYKEYNMKHQILPQTIEDAVKWYSLNFNN